MCLAVPMKIMEVKDNSTGIVELEGTKYDVDLSLIADPAVGDFVIIHAGFAIEKLDPEEADTRLDLFTELAKTYEDKEPEDQ